MINIYQKKQVSSYYALQEANRWKHVANLIDDKKNLCREYGVILSYSSELYLKAILLYYGIMVSGHNLFSLYKKIPESIKNTLNKQYNLKPIEKKDWITGEIVGTYTGFEEALHLVSYDFVDLRYIFEKYKDGKAVFVTNEVHIEINNILEKFARNLNFEWV